MATKIRDTDHGLKALMKRMEDAVGSVTIGVHDQEGAVPHGDGDATVLDVALFHEFGTADIPARPFLAGDDDQAKAEERMRKIGQALIVGKIKTVEQGLNRFGLIGVAEIQKRISDGIPPPLADSTVEAKGSSTPLIDTGTLRSSITYQVHDDSEPK